MDNPEPSPKIFREGVETIPSGSTLVMYQGKRLDSKSEEKSKDMNMI